MMEFRLKNCIKSNLVKRIHFQKKHKENLYKRIKLYGAKKMFLMIGLL